MSLYEPNYPPHGKSEIISGGDTKKNIINRERKELGMPDAGTRGREPHEVINDRSEKEFQNERKESLTRKATLSDEKLERQSAYYESQFEQSEESDQDLEVGLASDLREYKEDLSEIEKLHEEALVWNDRHLGANSAELKEILREEKKRREFSEGSGSKGVSSKANRVKHVRG